MAGENLSRRGKHLLLGVVFAFISVFNSYSFEAKSTLSRNKIAPGGSTTLLVSISGADDISITGIGPKGKLDISYDGDTYNMKWVNGKSWKGHELKFTISAPEAGTYRVPSIEFNLSGEKYKTKEKTLYVSKKYSSARGRGRSSLNDPLAMMRRRMRQMESGFERNSEPEEPSETIEMKPELEFSKREVMVGESFVLRYVVITDSIEGFEIGGFYRNNLPQISSEFVKRDEGRDAKQYGYEKIKIKGKDYYKIYLATLVLIPTETGEFTMGGGRFFLRVSGGFFGRNRFLNYPQEKVKVIPLPVKNKPDQFNGNIGKYEISIDKSSFNSRLYGENRVEVKISGSGDIPVIAAPLIKGLPEGIRVIKGEGVSTFDKKVNGLEGSRVFSFIFIPEKSGNFQIQPLEYTYFNREKNDYETLVTDPITINVKSAIGEKKTDIDLNSNDSSFSSLSLILIVVVIVLIALGLIFFLIFNEHRKYKIVSVDAFEDKKKINLDNLGKNRNALSKEEIQQIVKDKNSELLLKRAEKVVNDFSSQGSEGDKKQLSDSLKSKLISLRYGGGNISDKDFQEIAESLMKLI